MIERRRRSRERMPGAGSRGCPECAGRGRCRTCRGERKLEVKGSKQRVDCYECDGEGRCWLCRGRARVTDELFEARQAYEARVRRLAGAAGRGRSAPALARLLLDARRALRGWDVPAMERTLAEFDRACS